MTNDPIWESLENTVWDFCCLGKMCCYIVCNLGFALSIGHKAVFNEETVVLLQWGMCKKKMWKVSQETLNLTEMLRAELLRVGDETECLPACDTELNPAVGLKREKAES